MSNLIMMPQGTRESILLSALTLFHEKGFDATSVQEITDAAGCTKDTFYLFFDTKFDLLIKMEEKLFTDIDNIISKELAVITNDPFAQIDRAHDECFLYAKNTNLTLIRLSHTSEILGIIEEDKIAEKYISLLVDKISGFISKGIEKGHFRALNPKVYGRIICDFVHQMVEALITDQHPVDFEVLKPEISIIVRKILEKKESK